MDWVHCRSSDRWGNCTRRSGRRRRKLIRGIERDRRIAPDVAEIRAVELVEITEILIVPADADVIREHPIRRRAAGFYLQIVIVCRRSDAAVDRCVAGERSGLDDLIDEPRKPAGALAGGAAPGVDLQLLLTERSGRAARIVVKRAIDRYAVELVTDLVEIAAADINDLIPALLIRWDISARDRGDRRIGVVEIATPAETGCGLCNR